MDHIAKALEKAQSGSDTTVRDWMQARQENAPPHTGVQHRAVHDDAGQREDVGQTIHLDPVRLQQNKVVAATQEISPVTDRYRLLRTRLVQIMRPRGWNVLGITSPSAAAGKTLTTVNLAITLARSASQHVYIIDADLRRPSVAHTLGFEPRKGLVDYLRKTASMEEIFYHADSIPNLTIIPGHGSNSLEFTNELIDSPEFAQLVRHLKSAGERALILVDTPPIQVGDDVLAATTVTDCFLLLVEEGKTTSQEIQDAARLLSDHNLIGSVLNKSSEKPKKFESYYDGRTDEREQGS